MAIGVDEIKTSGRLIFDLVRNGETTSRVIDVPYPINDEDSLQAAVNAANSRYTSSSGQMDTFIQPSNWRDSNTTEEQWTTTGVSYEMVTTITKPITPENT